MVLSALGTARADLLPKMPPDISVDGYRIDSSFDLTTKLITFYFIGVLCVLVFCMIRFRAGKDRKALYTHGNQRKHLLMTFGFAIFVFLSVDLNLVGRARADLKDAFWNYPDPSKALRVEVLAQQWAWNFRYAGPDREFGTEDDVVTLNDLRLPVDRPVLFQIKSKDVIHSFFLPNFRIKQDATPGRTSVMWVQAKETGRYEIACAEHCGFAHYEMRSAISVVTPQEFETWYQETSADSKKLYRPDDAEAHWGWAWEARGK